MVYLRVIDGNKFCKDVNMRTQVNVFVLSSSHRMTSCCDVEVQTRGGLRIAIS
jgi:hypothetical protein